MTSQPQNIHQSTFSAAPNQDGSTHYRAQSTGFITRTLHGLSKKIRAAGYSTGLYQYRLRGRHPLQLLASPDDPTIGDATHGQAIIDGTLFYHGHSLPVSTKFWTDIQRCPADFMAHCHSFSWLQDLAQIADQRRAQTAAEILTRSWTKQHQRWDAYSWAPDLIGRRLINWFTHAPLILSAGDMIYRSSLLSSMAHQSRHLMRTLADAPRGVPQLYACAGLAVAGYLLPGGKSWKERGLAGLKILAKDFILPDGGPASRNLSDAIIAMQTFILVRDSAIETNSDLPEFIQTTLDRIAPYVRAMRHKGGAFAQMNGSCADYGLGINSLLARSNATGRPIEKMTHTGYQRISHGQSLLIADCGTPAATDLSYNGHAATGGFEFSAGREQIICSVGHADGFDGMPGLLKMTRTSAAHSCLVIGDRNMTEIKPDSSLGRGVSRVKTIREESHAGTKLSISHDGYTRRYKAEHSRILDVSMDGSNVQGEDQIKGANLAKLRTAGVVLRFHLHPDIIAKPLNENTIILYLQSGARWIFQAQDAAVHIDDSLYLTTSYIDTADQMTATSQIVVTPNVPSFCRWVLKEYSPHDDHNT